MRAGHRTAYALPSPSPQPSSSSGSLTYSPSMRCAAQRAMYLRRTTHRHPTQNRVITSVLLQARRWFIALSCLAAESQQSALSAHARRTRVDSLKWYKPSPSTCCRELARKYGSVSLSPHLPLTVKQPALRHIESVGMSALAAAQVPPQSMPEAPQHLDAVLIEVRRFPLLAFSAMRAAIIMSNP